MADFTAHADSIRANENASILGEGEGWLAWFECGEAGITRKLAVRSDDGQEVHEITIREQSEIGDTAEIASTIAKMTERERERALAAIQHLEAGNA